MAGLTEAINQYIDKMPPGIKMDYLVARTMGQIKFEHPGFTRVEEVCPGYTESKAIYICPLCGALEDRQESRNNLCIRSYSTNTMHAWEVVKWWITHNGDLFIEWWQDDEWFICDRDLYTRKDESIPCLKARSNRSDNVGWKSNDLPSFSPAICRLVIKKGIQDELLEDLEMKVGKNG